MQRKSFVVSATAAVLLAGPAGEAWCSAAQAAAAALGVTLDAYVTGADGLLDPSDAFADTYGITAAGAVIVRPDGIVGWRATDAADVSDATMRGTLASLLCRDDPNRKVRR